jgi:hypothetical protein
MEAIGWPIRKDEMVKEPRSRYYLAPKRILWMTEGEGASVEGADHLLEKRDAQSTLKPGKEAPCILRNSGSTAGILLDFGAELQGGIQITIWHTIKPRRTARLRVRFGESAMEAMSELGGETNATNHHAMRDQVIECSFLGTTEVGNTGFRFVRIDLLDEGGFVQIKSIRAFLQIRDLEYKGTFACSDPLLNDIWRTGAYTVHLNMQDYLWDGIKRDRLVWIGDMHPETSVIQAVFGYDDIVPRSLDFVRDDTPSPEWMNTFPSYSMWWILIQHDWYRQNGDLAYLKRQKDYLLDLLERLAAHIREDGGNTAPNPFLDWPSAGNRQAVEAGIHALLTLAMEAGSRLCTALGEDRHAGLCRTAIGRLRRYRPDPAGSKQAAALMALAGLIDPAAANRDIISVNGSRGISTFLGYYVLRAKGEAGDIPGCLELIREYWGGMLKLGATTFWEGFDVSWMENAARIDELTPPGKVDIHGQYGEHCYIGYRHSLCHGWAAGPTAWLAEYVLGVKIEEPGCRTIRIKPCLGDLEWAEGTYPTPLGIVRIRHDKQADGSIRSAIDAPEGIRVIRESCR